MADVHVLIITKDGEISVVEVRWSYEAALNCFFSQVDKICGTSLDRTYLEVLAAAEACLANQWENYEYEIRKCRIQELWD